MEKRKRGRPRKVEQAPPAPSLAMQQVNNGLDELALARDYIASIAAGGESPDQMVELSGRARESLNSAGRQIETGLRELNMPAAGWFTEEAT